MAINAIRCLGGVAERVDAGDSAAELVVRCAGCWQAYLSRVIGLPGRNLATEVIVLVAGGEPSDIDHVERDEARRGDHAPFYVIVPSRGRAIRLRFRDFMTAVPRRGRDLTGEVFRGYPLTLWIVRHLVSGDIVPNTVDVRICFLFQNFAAQHTIQSR